MASLKCLFFLLLNSPFVNCGMVSSPRNIAVVAGHRMEMRCRNDERYVFRSWQMHRVSDELEQMIFNYNAQDINFPQYGIGHDSPGSVTLYSNSTLSSDAGVYRCTTLDHDTLDLVTFSAQLIVFESDPYCQTSPDSVLTIQKGDSITIRCSVRFKGKLAPEIEWRQFEYNRSNNGQLVTHHEKSSENGHIISTLRVIVDFPTPRIFTFKTYFLSSSAFDVDSTAAGNAPDYTYTWNSPPIGPLPTTILPSSMATSFLAVKSSRHDNDESHTAAKLKTPASIVSATFTPEASKLEFVSKHWVLISVCVGIAVLVSFIVAAVISYSRCVRVKRQAAAQQVNANETPQFGTYVEMQRPADTYCSIGDDVVYNEINLEPRQLLAQRSLSSSSYARKLPRTPSAQPVQNPIYYKQFSCNEDRSSKNQPTNTMGQSRQNAGRGSDFTLASPLSTSLPTIHHEDSAPPLNPLNSVPVPTAKPNRRQNSARDPESSPYLAAKDIVVDENAEEIPSTYLRVNEQSKRNF